MKVFLLMLLSFSVNAAAQADDPHIPAEFPGGSRALAIWMVQHFQDADNLSEHITGRFYFSIQVEADGKVSEALLMCRDHGQMLKLHEFSSMPDWKPAMKDGKPVRSLYQVPIYIHFM